MNAPKDQSSGGTKKNRTFVKVDSSVAKMSDEERSDFARALYRAIMAEWGRNPDGSEREQPNP